MVPFFIFIRMLGIGAVALGSLIIDITDPEKFNILMMVLGFCLLMGQDILMLKL